MSKLKKICTILVMFLIFAVSIGFVGLPVILSIALGSWFWLFLYSIHVISILFIGLCCLRAKEGVED